PPRAQERLSSQTAIAPPPPSATSCGRVWLQVGASLIPYCGQPGATVPFARMCWTKEVVVPASDSQAIYAPPVLSGLMENANALGSVGSLMRSPFIGHPGAKVAFGRTRWPKTLLPPDR